MKHNFYPLAPLSFCALLAFGSCSKDEITTAQENQITLNGHKLNISIQEEAFEAEKPVSRSTQPAKTDTVDLGNDLYAEVSVEPDTEAPAPAKTRAAMSDGHYTIYAVDASNNRLPDELSGTVSAGRFFPDHNQNIDLTPGTYTFVCFNDAVEDKGNGLDIKNEVENPMIGVTTETISGEHYKISFIMKHWSARVRYEVTTYTAYPANLSAQIRGYTGDCGIAHFDQKGNFKNRDTGTFISTTVNINKAGNEAFSPIKKAFLSKSDYSYISVRGGWCKAYISGTVHGKSVTKEVWINSTPLTNHSYLIKLNLKTKDPLYLYQDGTVGYIGDKTAERKPIAAVVKEKTSSTEEGTAIALRAASWWGSWDDMYSGGPRYANTTLYNATDAANDMEGYKWTWEPSGTTNGEIKANNSDYNCFYAAAHYNPGVTVTGENVGKWYLPALGEWNYMARKFFNWDGNNPGDIGADHSKGDAIFTNAGGSTPYGHYGIFLSTEATPYSYLYYLVMGGSNAITPTRYEWYECLAYYGDVVPFVHF